MPAPSFLLRALAAACALAGGLRAQNVLPAVPVALDSAADLKPFTGNWQLAGGVAGNPRRDKVLAAAPGTGVLVCNPTKEQRGHLFTAWEHGDLELELEFLLSPGSNSGVYLQGRYEVQLFDSWGVRTPKAADCGGIYQRWDAARGKGNELFDGHAPLANAARAPGLWQKLQIEFEAPRFDATGKKTANARFRKVVLNGFTIHENVEISGPTRSSAFNDEQPLGPIMIQGDHGPVAIRRLAAKRFATGARVEVADLKFRLYPGAYGSVGGSYEKEKPKAEGVPETFSLAGAGASGRFAVVFTGTLKVPKSGDYRFAIESGSSGRLLIGGRPVVLPIDKGSQPGIVTLAAGTHEFRLDLAHGSNARPAFELVAEGPGLAPHTLTAGTGPARARGAANRRTLLVEPADRTLLQRGFVPFEPRKRLYAAAVGTPAGVHFAYDFETGAVLHAWRGSFVDTFQMWDGRGSDQTAKPAGPLLTFQGKPTVGLIEYAANGDWPTQPETFWTPQGYTLEADGTPVFKASLYELTVSDRLAPAAGGPGLERTLTLGGKLPSWSTWVLLAEADRIVPQPDGTGWIVGDRAWYLDWPADAAHRPVLRTVNGRQQLAVPLAGSTLAKPIRYSIVW